MGKSKDILNALPVQNVQPFKLQIEQTQPEPVQILTGPEPRKDGYQIREEYGMPMNDAQYKAVQGVQKQYGDRADKYLSEATADLDRQVAERKTALGRAKAPNIPGYKGPSEVTIWASGDGDNPQAYRFPAESAEKILKEMTKNGYYRYKRHSDGSYGIAFGEYGKEGYEALNEAQKAYGSGLQSAKDQYNAERSAALGRFAKEKAAASSALTEAEKGAKARVQDQYDYLSGLFGQEMAGMAQDWGEKRAKNSQSIQQLVAGGVLKHKVGKVG